MKKIQDVIFPISILFVSQVVGVRPAFATLAITQQLNDDDHDQLKVEAKNGNPQAMYQYGKLKMGAERDEWISKSAESGYGPALLEVANKPRVHTQSQSKTDKQKNYKEFSDKLRTAHQALLNEARSGDLESTFMLGSADELFGLHGITQKGECIPWLRKAADLGHPKAPFELAAYLQKRNTSAEQAESIEWYKRSVEVGETRSRVIATVALVKAYSYGISFIGLRSDAGEALRWAQKGASLEGTSIEDYLMVNGLQDPRKIRPELKDRSVQSAPPPTIYWSQP